MKKLLGFVAIVALFLATSCSAVKETAPVMAIGSNNIITNVKADVDYQGATKIKGSATTHRVLWIFKHTANGNKMLKANNRYKGLGNTESVALYRAKKAADVDLVLEPQFETETHSYFFGIYKKTTVNMSGWGANIKGFKDASPEFNRSVEFGSSSIF